MNKCPKCNILIVPYDIDKYYCKDKHKWNQKIQVFADVVMYCSCFKKVFMSNKSNRIICWCRWF